MDVLKTARRQAGLNIAVLKVYTPLTLLGALMLIGIFISRLLGYEGEYGDWLFILLGCIVIGILVGSPIAYFVGRKNPRLIRKELENMITIEQWMLPKYQEMLVEYQRELQNLPQKWHADMEEMWRECEQEATATSIRNLEHAIEVLRKKDRETSQQYKIRNQEVFLRLQQEVREGEAFLEKLRGLTALQLPEEAKQKMLQSTQEDFNGIKKSLEAQRDVWQEKINVSLQTIAEAQKNLKGFVS